MSTAVETPLHLTCSQCQGQFCVRSRSVLKPGAKSACTACGSRFFVVADPRLVLEPPRTAAPAPMTLNPSAESDPSASKPQTPKTYKPGFHGQGGSLFGIHLVNVCLTLLTLALYSFWAKVRIRKYLYSQTQFAGDRFAYHGTGRELLHGASKATFVFGLPYLVISNASLIVGGGTVVFSISQILATLLALIFLPVAIVGARRYRLSRSSWRGIHFSFRGQAVEFMKLFITGALLTGVTLGAYYPVFDLKRQRYLAQKSYVGTHPFSFDGEDWALAMDFVRAVVLLPFTLGLSWFWYSAARQRYVWKHTALGTVRFSCSMQGNALMKLRLVNFLLLVCSLGLAWPWTAVRNVRFIMSTLSLKGTLDFEQIVQDAQTANATGEGLSSFLDSGFDLG
jgi:uncharacterized membrane protein YjgN (DUF898 family)/DNA-directed RNA polymerase subunit RPC12/RpoP